MPVRELRTKDPSGGVESLKLRQLAADSTHLVRRLHKLLRVRPTYMTFSCGAGSPNPSNNEGRSRPRPLQRLVGLPMEYHPRQHFLKSPRLTRFHLRLPIKPRKPQHDYLCTRRRELPATTSHASAVPRPNNLRLRRRSCCARTTAAHEAQRRGQAGLPGTHLRPDSWRTTSGLRIV